MASRPPNSTSLMSVQDAGSEWGFFQPANSTCIIEEFSAYIGAPDVLLRNALVVIDHAADDGLPTIWQASVGPSVSVSEPYYVTENGRWVIVNASTSTLHTWSMVPTTGMWDFKASGFLLAGVNPGWPFASEL